MSPLKHQPKIDLALFSHCWRQYDLTRMWIGAVSGSMFGDLEILMDNVF
jgi:hypothetical protein